MTVLLVPAAGDSTRFELNRPKFLLQHPFGRTMLAASLSGLRESVKDGVKAVFIVMREEHLIGISQEKLSEQICEVLDIQPEFVLLPERTNSQVETILKGIEAIGSDEPLIIKDCDNYIELTEKSNTLQENYVAFANLRKFPKVVAFNKAFIQLDEEGKLLSIYEKEIVSPNIYVGLAKFSLASTFIAAHLAIEKQGISFVSDIVRIMIDQGYDFRTREVSQYSDWGTISDWRQYLDEFQTLFVDIDGVLSYNMSPISISKGWDTFDPIEDNLQVLLEKQYEGRTKIVFVTSRSSKYRETLIEKLHILGFTNFELLCDMPHCKRVLVNDYADTNCYPTALALNLPRNQPGLRQMLENL